MVSERLKEFRSSIDADVELKSKRSVLIGLSVIMIAFNVAGASLEEANTFIFKLKVNNHENLVYLFLISIVYMTMRYYAYAKTYHDQLFELWSDRMLKDYRIFHYTPRVEEIDGLLSGAIDVWPGDESGIQSPSYKVSGFFKRNLTYECTGFDDIHGEHYYTENIELFKFRDGWGFTKYVKLLSFEVRYQIEALLKYRESLDLLFPYMVSVVALLSLIYRDIKIIGA